MSDNQNSRVYGIVVTVLLVLAAGLGFFFWQKSKNYLAETQRLEAERTSLEKEKTTISKSLDSLSAAYADVRTENENLQGKVNGTAALVQQKEAAVRQIRDASAKDIATLKVQIEELRRVKLEYETIISTLKSENEQLKNENQHLTAENSQLKGNNTELTGQVKDLAKQLEEQIRKTQSATFKATSFKVEVDRKGEKMTVNARRAKSILVSFDLVDVPQAFQGAQKLYLAITDDKGNPISAVNPTKATVNAPSGPVEILAQMTKAVALGVTQRESFTYKLDEKLKQGNYVVAIYCDKGLLGASSFRLGGGLF
jgi:peptidoglycan hydrolase CwlO-like protein